jgi:hypothetical protein
MAEVLTDDKSGPVVAEAVDPTRTDAPTGGFDRLVASKVARAVNWVTENKVGARTRDESVSSRSTDVGKEGTSALGLMSAGPLSGGDGY